MATYPTQGQEPWDADLKGYIDAVGDGIPGLVEDAVEDYTPGAIAQVVEVITPLTHTSAAYPGVLVPALSATVTGNGRAVDVRLHIASLSHSTPGTKVTLWLVCDAILGPMNQLESFPANGQSVTLERTFVIPDGQTKTWAVYSYAEAAGTTTLNAAEFSAHTLKVTRG